MGLAGYAGLAIGSAALSWLRRRFGPRAESLKPLDFGQLEEPATTRGAALPIVFGRTRVDGLALLSYADKFSIPINAKGITLGSWHAQYGNQPWELLETATYAPEVAGFRYGLTWCNAVSLFFGDLTHCRGLYVNDQKIWSGKTVSVVTNLYFGNREHRFIPADVNTAAETIAIADHGFITGEGPVTFVTDGTLPAPLVAGTSYWLIYHDDDFIKVATSRANALAGTAINLTATGSGIHRLRYPAGRNTLNFATTDVDTGTDAIAIASHGMQTGHGPVRFGNSGGGLPAPLSSFKHRDWWIIRVDDGHFQVAFSFDDAINGAFVSLTSQGTGSHYVRINPDVSNFFGGPGKGGGLQGSVEVLSGAFNQPKSVLMARAFEADAGLDSDDLPAHRGLGLLVWGGFVSAPTSAAFEEDPSRGFHVGESPSMLEVGVEWQCIPNELGLGAIGEDANPAEVLWKFYTAANSQESGWVGLGLSTNDVDSVSFLAAGTALAAEEHGVSGYIGAGKNAEQVIEEILAQIDAFIRFNPTTGKIELKLNRDDYL